MIKLLHMADLHLGSRFRAFSPRQAATMEARQETMLRRLVELCHREECQLVLVAGDVFEGSTVDRDLIRLAANCFGQMGVPVFIAPGNHDPLGLNSPYDQIVWPENVHIFRRPQLEAVVLDDLDLCLWGAGYTAMDCPPLLEGFRGQSNKTYRLGLLHGDAVMTGSPYCPITREQVAASNLHYLALGHIHRGSGFVAGQTACAWPGCPMGRGFHECGTKGALVVTLSDCAPEVRFVDLGLGLFRELSVAVGEDAAGDILRAVGEDTSDLACRVILTGQREPVDTDALWEQLGGRFFLLELRDETAPPVDVWASAGEDTLEGLYFGLLQKAMEEAGAEEQQTLTLAAKLSRRLLDGQEVKLP